MRSRQSLVLTDGRALTWEDAGDPSGAPILFCHGTPGSQLQRSVFIDESLLLRTGIRVITPDRPGMGHSDFQSCRNIRNWPDDVARIVERLRLRQLAVLGFSGGTPYAIALAASSLPVRALGIVSGDAPPHRVKDAPPGLPATALRRPRTTSLVLRLVRCMARFTPQLTADFGTRMLGNADRKVVADPVIRQRFLWMLKDALRQGPRGTLVDLQLAAREWQVLRPRQAMPVHIWHGEADADAPIAIAHYLAESLPGAKLRSFPSEGHVSVFVHHAEEILQVLASSLSTMTGALQSQQLKRTG